MPQRMVGRFRRDRELGVGMFSKVVLGIDDRTGEQVAIKIMRKEVLEEMEMSGYARREAFVLRRLHHPNLVKFVEAVQSDSKLFLIMHVAPGQELLQLVPNGRMLDEDIARTLISQLVDVVAFLHRKGIAHRDLKPENIIIDSETWHLTVIDLGLTGLVRRGEVMRTVCGSEFYSAPEVAYGDGRGYDGTKADAWSVGVLAYMLLTGAHPFVNPEGELLHHEMRNGLVQYPATLSRGAVSFLSRLLSVEPQRRYSMAQASLHPWLTGIAANDAPEAQGDWLHNPWAVGSGDNDGVDAEDLGDYFPQKNPRPLLNIGGTEMGSPVRGPIAVTRQASPMPSAISPASALPRTHSPLPAESPELSQDGSPRAPTMRRSRSVRVDEYEEHSIGSPPVHSFMSDLEESPAAASSGVSPARPEPRDQKGNVDDEDITDLAADDGCTELRAGGEDQADSSATNLGITRQYGIGGRSARRTFHSRQLFGRGSHSSQMAGSPTGEAVRTPSLGRIGGRMRASRSSASLRGRGMALKFGGDSDSSSPAGRAGLRQGGGHSPRDRQDGAKLVHIGRGGSSGRHRLGGPSAKTRLGGDPVTSLARDSQRFRDDPARVSASIDRSGIPAGLDLLDARKQASTASAPSAEHARAAVEASAETSRDSVHGGQGHHRHHTGQLFRRRRASLDGDTDALARRRELASDQRFGSQQTGAAVRGAARAAARNAELAHTASVQAARSQSTSVLGKSPAQSSTPEAGRKVDLQPATSPVSVTGAADTALPKRTGAPHAGSSRERLVLHPVIGDGTRNAEEEEDDDDDDDDEHDSAGAVQEVPPVRARGAIVRSAARSAAAPVRQHSLRLRPRAPLFRKVESQHA